MLSQIAAHLGRIDGRLGAIERHLGALEAGFVALSKELAEVNVRVSQMPTALQIFLGIVATVAMTMAGMGLLLANASSIVGVR